MPTKGCARFLLWATCQAFVFPVISFVFKGKKGSRVREDSETLTSDRANLEDMMYLGEVTMLSPHGVLLNNVIKASCLQNTLFLLGCGHVGTVF